MTKEYIVRMAREAGLWETRHSVEMAIGGVGELERFAALVASAERSACAKQLDALGCDHCANAIIARGSHD